MKASEYIAAALVAVEQLFSTTKIPRIIILARKRAIGTQELQYRMTDSRASSVMSQKPRKLALVLSRRQDYRRASSILYASELTTGYCPRSNRCPSNQDYIGLHWMPHLLLRVSAQSFQWSLSHL